MSDDESRDGDDLADDVDDHEFVDPYFELDQAPEVAAFNRFSQAYLGDDGGSSGLRHVSDADEFMARFGGLSLLPDAVDPELYDSEHEEDDPFAALASASFGGESGPRTHVDARAERERLVFDVAHSADVVAYADEAEAEEDAYYYRLYKEQQAAKGRL